MIEQICNWVVLVSAVIIAATNIFRFFGKPVTFMKKKSYDEEKKRVIKYLEEMLPDMLVSHDLETREKYKNDRQRYLEDISNTVIKKMSEILSKQNQNIDILTRSSKDVLREKIMAIYHKNKERRTLECYEREALEQYYIDYKAMNGNSYIDKYYKIMKKWAVLPAEISEDEE